MRLPWSHQAEKFREVRGGSPSKLREFRQCLTDGQSHPGPHLKGDSQPLSPSLTQACFNLVKESLFLTSFLFSHHTHTLNTVVLHTHTHTIKTPHCTQSHQTSHQAHAYPLLTSTPQSLASQTQQHTAHHSHDSTACTPPFTHAPLMSTPLHAQFHTHILQYSTHIIFTYTLLQKLHAYTQSHYIHTQPSIFTSRLTYPHEHRPLHPYSSHTHAHAPRTLYSLPTIHTHTTTQNFSVHIYTPLPRTCTHTTHATLCTFIHLYTHTFAPLSTPPPYPHSHTPLHTCTQTHKLTHTSFTPPYSKMLMTTLSTPLSLISRSVLPTCPSCICHHSLLRSLSSARLITFLLWRL